MAQIQYISDEHNKITGVIVPIDLWQELQSEKETAYLLKSKTMKKRLLEAKNRKENKKSSSGQSIRSLKGRPDNTTGDRP